MDATKYKRAQWAAAVIQVSIIAALRKKCMLAGFASPWRIAWLAPGCLPWLESQKGLLKEEGHRSMHAALFPMHIADRMPDRILLVASGLRLQAAAQKIQAIARGWVTRRKVRMWPLAVMHWVTAGFASPQGAYVPEGGGSGVFRSTEMYTVHTLSWT